MVYVSICLCHLWYQSSASYSFMSTVPMTFLVGLFLRVLFFEMVNGIVSLILLSDISLLVYRNAAVFYIFCIQQVYSVH